MICGSRPEPLAGDVYKRQVAITVYAISGKECKGKITAISGATGSKYSLVPTEMCIRDRDKRYKMRKATIEIENIKLAQENTRKNLQTQYLNATNDLMNSCLLYTSCGGIFQTVFLLQLLYNCIT